jgi:hypothetical protein
LISEGATVFTTNFDTRIEAACSATGVPLRRSVVASRAPSVASLKHANLVKLHGTFSGPSARADSQAPVGTLQQIAGFGLGYERLGSTRRVLLDLLDGETLIVCGYSGWDSFDVMPLLESLPSATRILWLDWHARGPLRQPPASTSDHLIAWNPRLTPVDAFVALRAEHGASPATIRLRGPSHQLLDAVWASRHERAFMDTARLRISQPSSTRSNLSPLRKALRLIDPLAPAEATLIVEALGRAYGNERVADEQLEDRPEPKALGGQVALRRALDVGDIKSATRRFVQEIERSESDEDLQPQAENLVWILEKMFWHALQLRQHAVAAQVLRRLDREASRRRVLWAQVLVIYLRGNLLHSSALRAKARGAEMNLREQSRVQLWRALEYAIRIPRLDIAIDAARLLLYVERDRSQQTRLETAISCWLNVIPPGENHFLALFDLLRRHVIAGRRPAPQALLERMLRHQDAVKDVVMAPGYLAIAQAYVSLYKSPGVFQSAMRRLKAVVEATDSRFRGELQIEMDGLRDNEHLYRTRVR